MSFTEGRLSRADLLKVGAAGALGLTVAGPAFARSVTIEGTTLNMLTWSDHYANDQLKAVNKATQIQGRPTLFSDNADAYLKIKHTGSQFDIVSGDALWVPKYHKDGLTTSFPLSELSVSKQLYPIAKVYLRAPAAKALADVQHDLAAEHLGLKVFDGYRPYSVTEKMWEPIRNPDFVADPAKGSRHNRGAAVDLTLVDLAAGEELAMPTPYDDFTPRARADYAELPPNVIANRTKLRDAMVRHGFDPLPSEWWHFDFRGWERFDLMNVPVEELAKR